MTRSDVDVFLKISCGGYDPKVPCPSRPSKPTLKLKHNVADAEGYVLHLKAYEKEMVRYEKDAAAYRKSVSDAEVDFRVEALEYCGLMDHPRADKAFSLALERGHSGGKSDVLSNLEDLADLLLSDL